MRMMKTWLEIVFLLVIGKSYMKWILWVRAKKREKDVHGVWRVCLNWIVERKKPETNGWRRKKKTKTIKTVFSNELFEMLQKETVEETGKKWKRRQLGKWVRRFGRDNLPNRVYALMVGCWWACCCWWSCCCCWCCLVVGCGALVFCTPQTEKCDQEFNVGIIESLVRLSPSFSY